VGANFSIFRKTPVASCQQYHSLIFMRIPAANIFTKIAGKFSLRTILIVPFVLQIVGTVGLVGYLSYINGQQAVNQVVSRFQGEISDRVNFYLKNYLATPHLITRIDADAVSLGQLNLQDLPAIERHLFRQMKQFDSIGGNLFGSNRGNFIGSTRHTGKDAIIVSDLRDNTKISIYLADILGNRGKIENSFRQPDVRQRPWYKSAAIARKPTWTPIFQLGDRKGLSINANRPIYAPENNELLGVFSVSLNLKAIGLFLNSLHVGKSGKVFIVERSGLLVANSTPELPYITSKQEFKRLKATESRNRLISATARYLIENFGSEFSRLDRSEQLEFKVDGKRQFVQIVPFQDEFGLDWSIVVVIPESDFMEQINANNRTTILLCIAALIASTSMGIVTARWIAQPIRGLNKAAKDIARGKWNKTVEINRADEVGELANSFNHMAAQLQDSFSELQSLNAALVRGENRLHQILEAMPVGVAVHDITGKLIYTNHISRQLLRIETLPEAETEQLAETYRVYQAGTDRLYPTEKIPIVRSLQGEKVRVEDMEIRFPDRIFPLEVYSTPLFDERGQIVGAIAAFADITDRKQAEKILADYNRTLEAKVTERTTELAAANSQLKQEICDRKLAEIALAAAKEAAESASLAKSSFLANMSHELRTPLNGIMGYAQILQADPSLTVKQYKSAGIIYQCSQHLLTLINDILSLSKIEANKLEIEPEMFDFTVFLQELSEIFRLKAQQKSIDFTFLSFDRLPQRVCADEKRLRQILMNLLSNAVKFTARGSVTLKVEVIKTENSPHAKSQIANLKSPIANPLSSIENRTSKIEHRLVRFQIEDTGCGIAPEHLQTIFLPFEQVGNMHDRAAGTGLGLAITQKLISLMNSEIFVSSQPGIGSRFWFDLNLPFAADSSDLLPVIERPKIAGYQGKKQKILVVDDIWENRSVIVNLLAPIGFEMREAADGRSGLETAIEFQPDLIFSDLVMPRMDGLRMIRELRQLPDFQSTIIIAVSASVFKTDRQNCLQAGYTDFLAKPIQAAELLDKIQSYLNLSWIYDRTTGENFTAALPQTAREPEMVLPPIEELLALYQAAQGGDVEAVEVEVIRLKQLSQEYTPFTAKVLELSADFEYREIVKWIDREGRRKKVRQRIW
jgi:signal transduction histidine kinase/DNA-binding NarL/FixJ family response regulator